jgi:hypothetical protein
MYPSFESIRSEPSGLRFGGTVPFLKHPEFGLHIPVPLVPAFHGLLPFLK